MASLSRVVKELVKDLEALHIEFAFVGALAIGARGRARQTIDADIAVTLPESTDAQSIVDRLVLIGYGINNIYRNTSGSIALARLFSKNEESRLIELDFLFELSGIEAEAVASAEMLEIWPGLMVPVASVPALLAMKARCQDLPERIQDKADLVNQLIPFATAEELAEARKLIKLIEFRGFNGGRQILKSFDNLVALTGK